MACLILNLSFALMIYALTISGHQLSIVLFQNIKNVKYFIGIGPLMELESLRLLLYTPVASLVQSCA